VRAVRKILAVDAYPAFFTAVNLQTPSPAHMTGWLRQSWANSLRKRYHRADMDFARVHVRPPALSL
jgi:hypothetical protein